MNVAVENAYEAGARRVNNQLRVLNWRLLSSIQVRKG